MGVRNAQRSRAVEGGVRSRLIGTGALLISVLPYPTCLTPWSSGSPWASSPVRGGRCRLPPHQRALVGLVYLRRPGLRPAGRHPDGMRPSRRQPVRHLSQAPLARGERAGGDRPCRETAVDLTRPAGPCPRPGPVRTHRIIRICEREGNPVLADRAYRAAGPWVTTALRSPPGCDLTPTQQTINRAPSAARAPVERGVARLKSWRISRRDRCSPRRMSSIAAAVLTLEQQR